MSLRRLRRPKGSLTAEQKSAEGILGYAVGKVSEHSNAEKRSQQIGQAGTVTEGPNERSGKYDMDLNDDKRQHIQLELDFSFPRAGEACGTGREEVESSLVAHDAESPANTNRSMEEACERKNLKEALQQVKANKGSAGIDRMTVVQLSDYLKEHWPEIREQSQDGIYEPKPVRRVEIPKPDSGVRKLGIQPCWID